MATTTSTTLTNLIQTYYDRRLLDVFRKELKFGDFASERKVTNANTVRFSRVEKLTRAAAKVEGTPSTPEALSTNYLEITMAQWAKSVQFTDLAETDILMGDLVNIATDRIGLAMAERADYQVAKYMALHSFVVRQGMDTAFRAKGTASSGSTTTLVCSTLAGMFADDYFNGARLFVYEGTNAGISRQVADFTGSTCTFTLTGDAFPQANDSTSKFVCWSINDMDAGMTLDTNTLLRMKAIAYDLGMKDIGGNLVMILPANAQVDFMKSTDDVWHIQSMNIPNDHWKSNTLGVWLGIRFVMSHQPWTESSAGAEDESAGTRIPLMLIGANSYSIARGSGGSGKYGIENFIVDKPDSVNHDMSYKICSSKMRFATDVTQASFIHALYAAYNRYF